MLVLACASCGRENRVPAARLDAKARCGQCKGALLPLARPFAVPDAASFDELVTGSPLPVLVDFWAAWCGPCRAVAPELEKLASSRPGRVVIAKLDTEAVPEIAARYGIRSIPTMILFSNGEEAKRISGAMPAEQIASSLRL